MRCANIWVGHWQAFELTSPSLLWRNTQYRGHLWLIYITSFWHSQKLTFMFPKGLHYTNICYRNSWSYVITQGRKRWQSKQLFTDDLTLHKTGSHTRMALGNHSIHPTCTAALPFGLAGLGWLAALNTMQTYYKVKLRISWYWRTDKCQQSCWETESHRGHQPPVKRYLLTINKQTGENQRG